MLHDKHTFIMYTHIALCGEIFVVDGAILVTLKPEIEPRHAQKLKKNVPQGFCFQEILFK